MLVLLTVLVTPATYSQTVVATVTVGSAPFGATYDHGAGEVFVTNVVSGRVSVISDSTNALVATINVGSAPFGAAYDSGKNEVFVTNEGSNSVSVISDSSNTVVATIRVGTNPYGEAYDPSLGEVFVTNEGSNSVSVISDSSNTVVATINVGSAPFGAAYDSGKNEVFVTNTGSSTVSAISDSTDSVLVTVPVGSSPYGLTYDQGRGELFVVDEGSNSVTVISDANDTVVATVSVGTHPYSDVYDPAKGEVFVTNEGSGTASVISDKTASTTFVSCSPSPVSSGSSTICTALVSGLSPTGTVTFSQSGSGSVLPSPARCTLVSAACSVTLTGANAGSVTIKGVYGGDSNNVGSTGILGLTISLAATTASLSCVLSSITLVSSTVTTGATTTITTSVITNSSTAETSRTSITQSNTSSSVSSATTSSTNSTVVTTSIATNSTTLSVTANPASTSSSSSTSDPTNSTTSVASASSTTTTTTITSSATNSTAVTTSVTTSTTIYTSATIVSSTTATASSPLAPTVSSAAVVGSPVKCSVTVMGASPTGKVTWSSSGTGKFSGMACKLSRGKCAESYTPASADSPVTITINYKGDSKNQPTSGTFALPVYPKASKTTASCSPTSVVVESAKVVTCKVKVTGYSPTGTVAWYQVGGTGSASMNSDTCTISKGVCSITLTGASGGISQIRAVYGGDSNNAGSVSSNTVDLTIEPAPTTLSVSCTPPTTGVGSSSICTATLSGFVAPVAGESITWSETSGSGGASVPASCTLSPSGTCSVTIMGMKSGSIAVRALFAGNQNNARSAKSFQLKIS